MTKHIDRLLPPGYINNPPVIKVLMPNRSPSPVNLPEVSTRRTRRKDARPGELLASALDLFVERGYAATRVDDIAQHAGVSKGTLFLYFPSKEDLFKAVVRENISVRFAEWEDEVNCFQGPTSDLLHQCLFGWWERIGSTQASGISKLMMSEAKNFPELADFYQREVIQPGNALIERILVRGVARGEFRTLDVPSCIFLVLAPMLFLAMWKHSLGTCCGSPVGMDPLRYLRAQLDMLLHGFAAPTPQSTALEPRPT